MKEQILTNKQFKTGMKVMIVTLFILLIMVAIKIKIDRNNNLTPKPTTKAEQQLFIESNSKPLWQTTTGHAIRINQDSVTANLAIKVSKVEDNYNKAIYYFKKQMENNSKFDDNIELYMQTGDYKYVIRAKKCNKVAKLYNDSLQIVAKQK